MPDLTTAQRLATYRAELRAAGFTNSEVWQLVEQAAPSLIEDVVVNSEPQPVTFSGLGYHTMGVGSERSGSGEGAPTDA